MTNAKLKGLVVGVGIAALAAFGLAAGCNTEPMSEVAPPADDTAIHVGKSYDQLIESYSSGETEYSGLYNNFEYKATLLNTPVRDAVIARQAKYYQWTREKTASEHETENRELASETQVFLSFYTPSRTNDNLADSKSIWSIYLDAGGRRYEGKAQRIKILLAELQTLYPYHSRWNTAYLVTFPIPTTVIETQPSTFTLTGPLGTKSIHFPAVH